MYSVQYLKKKAINTISFYSSSCKTGEPLVFLQVFVAWEAVCRNCRLVAMGEWNRHWAIAIHILPEWTSYRHHMLLHFKACLTSAQGTWLWPNCCPHHSNSSFLLLKTQWGCITVVAGIISLNIFLCISWRSYHPRAAVFPSTFQALPIMTSPTLIAKQLSFWPQIYWAFVSTFPCQVMQQPKRSTQTPTQCMFLLNFSVLEEHQRLGKTLKIHQKMSLRKIIFSPFHPNLPWLQFQPFHFPKEIPLGS